MFDNRVAAEDFVKAVKEADLGLSINISTSIDGAEQCCFAAGIPRHSVGYSLGFEGKTEKLPDSKVMLLSTMCGHGMVSHSLAKKMIDWVKEGRRTPEQAASYLTRFCSCGVFNPDACWRGFWKRWRAGSRNSWPDRSVENTQRSVDPGSMMEYV